MTRFSLALLLLCGCADPGGLTANGGACSSKADCASGLCVLASEFGKSTGWEGGLCTASCADTTCSDGVCVALESTSYCLGACTRTSDCRQGYVCDSLVGACLPDCQKGFSCGTKLACQTDGTCRTQVTTPPDAASCASDGDCTGTACPDGAAKGCVCILDLSNQKRCHPACVQQSDCPVLPGGPPQFCMPGGICAPPPG